MNSTKTTTTAFYNFNNKFDYGIIIKKFDTNNIIRIGIGGNSEDGTSGVAWYFSRNWESIFKKYGRRSFAILIRVVENDDSSANSIKSICLDKSDNRELIDFFSDFHVQKIINL